MKKTFSILLALTLLNVGVINACTNLLVGKNASTDGSTMITYAADSYWLFGALYHYPAATYADGEMLKVYEWDTGNYLGMIDQAKETYSVIGNTNEFQVTIGETTYTGIPELQDTTGLIDYGSLIYISLQRSKTAREALYNMVTLVEKYGYYSTGESFSIGDPNEIWIMDLIGKGVGNKGAVWVARRLPDDCISAHANQARITTFPRESRKDKTTISSKNLKRLFSPEVTTVYAHDVVSFAREKGYYTGTDAEFSFSDVYNPLDFGGLRFCEARVWSFFRTYNPEMEKYISYIKGETKERMPLWIKPVAKLSVADVRNMTRDHYEGTEIDMTTSMGNGAYNSPYRMTPLTYKDKNGVEYFHERPIATQQTGFTFVSQMRGYAPEVGGIFWFGVDDATCSVYVPIYSKCNIVPESFSQNTASILDFSWNSAFWVNNWVAEMTYNRYNALHPIVQAKQIEIETYFENQVKEIDRRASRMAQNNPEGVVEYLTAQSNAAAANAIDTWKKLGEYLMVKFLDGTVKGEKDGDFERNDFNVPQKVTRPGYSPEYIQRELVDPNPERYRSKTEEEMNNRK